LGLQGSKVDARISVFLRSFLEEKPGKWGMVKEKNNARNLIWLYHFQGFCQGEWDGQQNSAVDMRLHASDPTACAENGPEIQERKGTPEIWGPASELQYP
jgi:hypothetical protein